ncbi:MAG: glycosyltransferase family 4 protein [Actinobacteria bacterium]|nr:glycosyltransferase family 4 protein [Actinomycetota bacterium]
MRPIRIAVYGDVNLNIIDGSSIWLTSLVQVLHRIDRTQVTVLRKAPVRRDLVAAELTGLPRVELIDPPSRAALTPTQALDALEHSDQLRRFDIVVLRGYELSREAVARPGLAHRLWVYLTDIPQDAVTLSDDDRAHLHDIATGCGRLLCQTEQLRSHLEGITPAAANKTTLLPPMVAPTFTAVGDTVAAGSAAVRRLCYAGKFAPAWGVLELVAAFGRVRELHPSLELHVAGDKIHNPPDDPAFRPAVEAALTSTDGLVWRGGITRDQVAALLADIDVALSVRDHQLDDSLELSTKLLEYGAAGVPVVCNRLPMHTELFGEDYPLFVDNVDDLAAVLSDIVDHPTSLDRARRIVRRVAADYSYDRVADRLRPHLDRRVPDVAVSSARPPRVLVATHDRKFFDAISTHLQHCGVTVRFDQWDGHAKHDEVASAALRDWADVIICEWALGNAVWYSRHRRAGQRVIVRLHRMELDTEFPAAVAIDNVDRVVVVSELFRDKAVAQLGWPADRIAVVPNWVDTVTLDRPKLPGARFHLGLLGWIPHRKRVDRALDVIERLATDDDRWRLYLGGKLPWELRWVWMRLDEREYLTAQLDRIRESPVLRRAVSIDGNQRNVASWLRKIGFVLSPSDDESFHLAPAEGMASGAVPVIWPWETAPQVYGRRWLCADVDRAVAAITATDWETERQAAQRYVGEHYPLEPVVAAWADLVLRPAEVAAA